MAKIYKYHLVDKQGKYWEKNIPEYSQAETIRAFLQERDHVELQIEEEHVPQLHGHVMGRDPDLH